MTRIDFYQIDTDEDPLVFTCRLVELAYRRGHRVFVHAGSDGVAARLDDLLWTFRDDRFIPHARVGNATGSDDSPVRIGHDHEPTSDLDVMINLSGSVPDFFSRFGRVAEIVPKDENLRQAARNNFRFYKDRGYPLHYHEMSGATG